MLSEKVQLWLLLLLTQSLSELWLDTFPSLMALGYLRYSSCTVFSEAHNVLWGGMLFFSFAWFFVRDLSKKWNFGEIVCFLFILIIILRKCSAEGRWKAFSICVSHLTVIIVFHGTILFIYCRPSSGNSMDTDKAATVFYTVVIPMLNPLSNSIREKDVKDTFRKLVVRKLLCQNNIILLD